MGFEARAGSGGNFKGKRISVHIWMKGNSEAVRI